MGLFADNIITIALMEQRPKLNDTFIWLQIADTDDFKDYVVYLNTEEQLYLQGIDSTGSPLESVDGKTQYSPLTIQLKRAKGGKTARVENITLYDEGDYYESHEVEVDSSGFTIDADPQKETTNLFDEWGEDIVGLTDESLEKLVSFLVEKYVNYTRETIFKTNI